MSTPPSDGASNHSPKHFVLDTNVLLHNPGALFAFDNNLVVIPFTVIEELDNFKKNSDDIGRHARQVIRHLDGLRVKGKLSEGVEWNGHGGQIQVDMNEYEPPPHLGDDTPDNRIITVAFQHQKQGHQTVFISKDINARIKSDTLGITTQDFEAQKVNADRLYRGYIELNVSQEIIDQLYQDKQVPLDAMTPFLQAEQDEANLPEHAQPATLEVHPNQYVLMRNSVDGSHTGLGRRHGEDDHLVPVKNKKMVFGIIARNVQQTMAFDLLLDDDVKLVTLLGTAGTGKTLLALAAALHKTMNEQAYERVLVARPIMPMGRDIGFLPGDVDEKLSVWMQPIFDNVSYLLSTKGGQSGTPDSKTVEQRLASLRDAGKLVLEPLTYIRGRSIPNQFLIVDEAQNLTPHEVKTIVSRAGEGTKIVLTGDPYQIDNPYLDASSNGLTYAAERLKAQDVHGHVTLKRSERSRLAAIAAEHL